MHALKFTANLLLGKLCLIYFFSSLVQISTAQNIFQTYEELCDTCSHQLFLKTESTHFLKNNEYFGSFADGYMGIGFFLKPTLEYYLSKDTKLNFGIHVLKYSGRDKFTQRIPIFSLHHRFSDNFKVVFGNIHGTLNHGLEDPLFRFDRYYQNNVEYGLQFFWKSNGLKAETWVNWEKFILKDDPFQEEFTAGNNMNINLLSHKKLKLSIPVQTLALHRGGQIDASPHPITTVVNTSAGLQMSYEFNDQHSLQVQALQLNYEGLKVAKEGPNSQVFSNGKAQFLKLNYQYNRFDAMVGYWQANKFIAPKGEYLFQSVSEKSTPFVAAKRKLVVGKLGWYKQVGSYLKIELRLDGYYDLKNKTFEHAQGLYFIINERFFLTKLKVAD